MVHCVVINYRSLELHFSQFSPTVNTITILLCFNRCISIVIVLFLQIVMCMIVVANYAASKTAAVSFLSQHSARLHHARQC